MGATSHFPTLITTAQSTMRNTFILIAILLLAAASPALAQREQPWKKQIALDAGLDFPGGDVGKGLNMGYSAAATFYYQLITRQTFLSLSIGYHTFGVEGSSSSTLVTIPIQGGIRYNFALTGFQPYVGVEFGAYLSTMTVNDVVIGESGEADFGVQPKVGFRLPISPGFDFDASLKYHIVASEESFSFIGLNVGVAYTIE
jgi:hypothetical protein